MLLSQFLYKIRIKWYYSITEEKKRIEKSKKKERNRETFQSDLGSPNQETSNTPDLDSTRSPFLKRQVIGYRNRRKSGNSHLSEKKKKKNKAF